MTTSRLNDIVVRFWWVIALTTVIATAVMVGRAVTAEPIYEATSVVQVTGPFDGDDTFRDYDREFAERSIRTYIALADTEPVRAQVRSELGLEELPTIEAAPVPATELVEITVTAADPETAITVANAMAAVFVETRWSQTDGAAGATPAAQPTIMLVEPAETTTEDRPSVAVATILGVGLGGFAGLLLALGAAQLDHRVRSRREAEELTGLPVLFETSDVVSHVGAADIARWLATRNASNGSAPRGRVVLLTSASSKADASDLAHVITAIYSRLGFRVALLSAELPPSFEALRQRLEQLRADHDFIVITAADQSGSAIASLYTMVADDAVVVVNLDVTRRDDLARITTELSGGGGVRTALAITGARA